MATSTINSIDTIHERMVNVRKTAGLSQEEFARMVGTSRSVISQVEIGKIKPSYEVLVNTSRQFKVSYKYLLEGEARSYGPQDDSRKEEPGGLQRENELLRQQVTQLQELTATQRDLIAELKRAKI